MMNSREYWNQRFKSGDWADNEGNKQSLFHYNILLKNLPDWLKKEISVNKMSICDLGCGMGEGVYLLKKYFKDSDVVGVDFSEYAIKEAEKKYSNISFICSDITKFESQYDVVLSSNTLEHFEDPHKVFNKMIQIADKYFILLIPFQEENLYKEHFYSFNYNFFPLNINNHHLVYYKEIDRIYYEPKKYLDEKEILVVYANKNNLDINGFSLDELNNNYFDKFTSLKKDYDDLKERHKIFKDITHKMDDIESNLQHEEKVKEDLIDKNRGLESDILALRSSVDELKSVSENYLSQFLSEREKCEDLIEKNNESYFEVFNEQKRALIYKELSEKNLFRFNHYEKNYNILKKENEYLEESLNLYRSRKIVKTTDKILNVLKFFKSYLKRFKNKKKLSLPLTYNEYSETINSKFHKNKPKKLKDIKIAVILDEFSYNCLKHEFNAIPIDPYNWFEKFESEKPELFFCESAWSGIDSELRPWKGKIYSSVNFNYENRTILLSILEYCKKHGIPTIFWNKEDPTHFDDEVCNFVDTALKFDHIFTTSQECVQRYKNDYCHKSVHLLMFGAQPKLFNPIDKKKRVKDIIFAGSWYGNLHKARSKEMIEIFDNIIESGYTLKIYDRSYYNNDPERTFPKKYSKYINPPVPFNQIEKIYKESEYALNINTETKSKTMFARRVFELMLCNTLVLSNYSRGMHELFGDNIIFVNKDKINLSYSEKKRINNLYNVLKNHTYSQRFKQILDDIGYDYIPSNDAITVYYIIKNINEIDDVLYHFESISFKNKRLKLILGDHINKEIVNNISQKFPNDEILTYSPNINQNEVSDTPIGKSTPANFKKFLSLNDTPYFIFANLQLDPTFIEKAILHYSYLKREYGVTLGDKFTFKRVEDVKNVILSKELLIHAFESIFYDIPHEFSVYTCKI